MELKKSLFMIKKIFLLERALRPSTFIEHKKIKMEKRQAEGHQHFYMQITIIHA